MKVTRKRVFKSPYTDAAQNNDLIKIPGNMKKGEVMLQKIESKFPGMKNRDYCRRASELFLQ